MSEVMDAPRSTAADPGTDTENADPGTDTENAGAVRAEDLTRALDGSWAYIRERARRFELSRYSPPAHDLSTEDHRSRVLERLRAFGATGMPRIGFPASVGGSDDAGGGQITLEMLGYRDLSLAIKAGVQYGLYAGSVASLGTERHHREHLRPALDLDVLGCFAMTEAGHGSDVQSIETTAVYDPSSQTFEVHSPTGSSRKEYIGNAARDGSMAVVFAQLETLGERHGVHALLVPIRDAEHQPCPGVSIGDNGRKAGLNGLDNGRLSFDHVRVPREALLDRYGHVAADGTYSSPIESQGRRFFTMLGTLVRGRVSVGGTAQNAAKHALTIAVRRGLSRRQFHGTAGGDETLLLDYRAHQRRLLPALATSYALSFAQNELATRMHAIFTGDGPPPERDQRELESRAAGIKAIGTWHASATIQTCREACGGAGYLGANTLPQLRADTDVFTTFEGDNTILLQLVGKGLLTNYSAQFEDLDWRGMARLVAEGFVGAAVERTVARGVFQRLRRGDGVRDRSWHVDLLSGRETHLVETVAGRLRRSRGAGKDGFTSFNDVQPHLLEAARAHVDRVVLEAFVAAIDAVEDPALRRLLDLVCDLHVLSVIEAERGWYLEHNRMSPQRSKEVVRTVDELCAELRPHAGLLVDGFGIPEEWLDADILAPDNVA